MSEAPIFETLSPAGLPDGNVEDNAPVNVDAILQSILGRGCERFGMAAAVLRGESIIAQGVAGVRKGASAERITLDHRFHLGSCTKAMTATLVAMLVEESKLNWTTQTRRICAPPTGWKVQGDHFEVSREKVIRREWDGWEK